MALNGEFVAETIALVETNWNTLTAVAAGAFSVISWVGQAASKRQAEQAEAQVRKLQFESVRASIDAQINGWGGEVITLMSRAEQLVLSRAHFASDLDFDRARRALLAELSAAVDRGRLFFANVLHDRVGLERPAAFGGFRPAILDAIMLDHERLRRLAPDFDAEAAAAEASALLNARRAFVSELQRAIDPRRRDEVFRALNESNKERPRKNDYPWDGVVGLVDAFEAQYGAGTFWGVRPKTAEQLAAEAAAQTGKATDKGG